MREGGGGGGAYLRDTTVYTCGQMKLSQVAKAIVESSRVRRAIVELSTVRQSQVKP